MSNVLYFFVAKASVAGVVLPPLIVTITNHLIFNLEDDSYVLPIPMMYVHVHKHEKFKTKTIFHFFFLQKRLPFNWKTPIGYALSIVFVMLITKCVFICVMPTLCFTLGCGMLTKAFIEHLITDFNMFNKKIRKHPDHLKQLKQDFCSIARTFSELKELSIPFHFPQLFDQPVFSFLRFMAVATELLEYIFTVAFIWSLLTLCTSLLFFQFGLV